MARTAGQAGAGDIWVFGYGSLMWQPGFEFVARAPALLRGYHRSFCVYSHEYRGTPERPGLVLGLEPGGSCRGVAFLVAAARAAEVVAYLDAREKPQEIYRRKHVPIEVHADPAWPAPGHETHHGTARGVRREMAYAYVVRRTAPQYAGSLPPERAVALFLQGVGETGRAWDYLESTVAHLEEMGFHDKRLHDLRARVRKARGLA
jgi:glutathione-specific gamma-glutamylcyclotransferase